MLMLTRASLTGTLVDSILTIYAIGGLEKEEGEGGSEADGEDLAYRAARCLAAGSTADCGSCATESRHETEGVPTWRLAKFAEPSLAQFQLRGQRQFHEIWQGNLESKFSRFRSRDTSAEAG